ncbi:hypothetical protein BSNK01_22940 [Bacillaceae bacterium]
MDWWTVLLLLLCPLMMLFCMRGHIHRGHMHGDRTNRQEHNGHHYAHGTEEWQYKRELKELQQKVNQLAEQNMALKKELDKTLAAKKGDAS